MIVLTVLLLPQVFCIIHDIFFISLQFGRCGLLDCRHGPNAMDNKLGDLSTVGAQYWHRHVDLCQLDC